MPRDDPPPWAAGVPIKRERVLSYGVRYEIAPMTPVASVAPPRGPGRPNTLTAARRAAVAVLLAQNPRPSQRRLAAELAERFRVNERTARRWLQEVSLGQNPGPKPGA
jgi:hypothetical protein